MRNLRYILYIVLALVLAGCVKERWDEEDAVTAKELRDGDPVTINGSLELPVSTDCIWGTKAFVETPQVKALYVAVFNSADILYEVVKANPGTYSHPQTEFTPASEGERYLTNFNVTLTTVLQGDRYVHFIACSEEIPELEGGGTNMMDEGTFIRGLETTGAVVAYWDREHYTFITADTPMKNLPMVRNFAKVKVNVDPSVTNFNLLGFKVFNAPVYGTITPFNNNTDDYVVVNGQKQINFDRFADYAILEGLTNPYSYITGTEKYYGYMPISIEYDDLTALAPGYDNTGSTDAAFVSANFIGYAGGAHESEDSDYLYECSYRSDDNPFVILYAEYTEGGVTKKYYYKADFVYYDTEIGGNSYYNILRNFQYTLNITSVTGKGSNTIYDAFNSIALNNFDASIESQALTNIADEASRLYVSTTDILVTSGTSFTMYVKSGTGAGFATDDNNSITWDVRSYTSGGTIVNNASSIVKASTNETSGAWSGWRKVTVTCKDPSTLHKGDVYKQPIVFRNGDGLTRVVNITLRQPMTLTVDAQDFVDGTADTECYVDFSIPAGLTVARFPMYFYIEQEDNTLYPKALGPNDLATLSVESGATNIPGNTGNNYYYRRTITWAEYTDDDHQADINGIKTFRSWLKSIVGSSATTVWVFPAPENNYYYPVDGSDYTNQDTFSNKMITGKISFAYSGLQLNAGSTSANVGTANSGAVVTYSSSNTAVATVSSAGVVTAVSVGSATITASCGAYKNYTAASDSYPVEVTASTLSELSVAWTSEPVYVIPVGSTGTTTGSYTVVGGYDGAVTQKYESSNTSVASVSPAGIVTGVASGSAVITYTVTATGGSYADATRSVNYTVHVGKPESGTVYHEESFLGDGGYSSATDGADHWNGYTINTEIVTNGATYSTGTDVKDAFLTYTTYNAGTGYPTRHVWYNYYNYATSSGFGMAASGYGSIQAATFVDDPAPGYWDYHNQSYATRATLVSKDVNLSSSGGAKLTFYHAGNYFDSSANMQSDVHLRFSSDGGSTWSDPVSINYPTGNNWIYVKALAEIPAAYRTANFKLMFDYSSTNSRAGTWEIKNVTIMED